VDLFPDFRLVGVYLFYAPASQRPGYPFVKFRRKRRKTAFHGRKDPFFRDAGGKFRAFQDGFQGRTLFHTGDSSPAAIKRKVTHTPYAPVSIDREEIPLYT
jgi:hypothetical protein